MRTRIGGSLAALGILAVTLTGCRTSSWTEDCATDGELRRCTISVSGTAFHDLPFPVSGPVQGAVADRFRLEQAGSGTARFSAGGTDGETLTCERGQRVEVGDSRITCTEVGDTSLRFVIERDR
ncbi:hypothetical protein GCM10011512_01370 [Tersicoccus solisilvae]|uniref:Lipoprotein n=1 Tax=Tersicoccus solisilvae TaxID=1882339 RepID=A0ABQ1NML1_9MICC|nr:hypothetical protein [Tersicoccus solisilvae]GGC78541.1 hypothetical protein GCM10011512_01370 [Tersicoccus solisilvae]